MTSQESVDQAVGYVLDELNAIAEDYFDYAEGMTFMFGVEDEAELAEILRVVERIKKRLIQYTEENMGDLSD